MADQNFLRYLQGSAQTFNPYGAGDKLYNNTRTTPNLGPTANREGYAERDRKAKAKREAMLRKMQAGQSGNYSSSAWMRRRNYAG